MAAGKHVVYLRVSTDRQGKSGLGIEAQRSAVADFLNGSGAKIVCEFVEVESGKNNERPQLVAAIQACRLYGARLLIAKLDRLSRDAHFLLGLEKAGVEFVCADMPSANRLTVGILAMVAEEERRMISTRTKAALQAAKVRGTVLGGYRGYAFSAADRGSAGAARKSAAVDRAAAVAPAISAIREAGVTSLAGIAAALTERGVPTSRGKEAWSAMQVRRTLHMIAV